MARFTTASLAMQARLEERLHNHSQQTAFGVLSRFLRQDQQASQKASPELVVATWARQAGIGTCHRAMAFLHCMPVCLPVSLPGSLQIFLTVT